MGWIMLSLRRSELQHDVNDIQFQLTQLNAKKQRLSSFMNAVGDGVITPGEIASLGTSLFGDGLDFMGYSDMAAREAAEQQAADYEYAYSTVTAEQYYNNPALAAQASLYFDENGALDLERMQNEFYEEALKDFVNEYMMPKLNELENEIQNEQTNLETQLQSKEAELESIKGSISSSIQNSTIQLG